MVCLLSASFHIILCSTLLVYTTATRDVKRFRRHIGPSNECVLPAYPTNGAYVVVGLDDFKPGDKLPESYFVEFQCNKNYALSSTDSYLSCQNGIWSAPIPTCVAAKVCTLPQVSDISYECSLEGTKLASCDNAAEGTKAEFDCNSHLIDARHGSNLPPMHCKNGKWVGPTPVCTPKEDFSECGLEQTDNGTVASKRTFPWHVAIYSADKHEHVCGGSIINPRVVVTAAHCLSGFLGGTPPKENFIVVAGSYYRSYLNPSDNAIQINYISEIHKENGFIGYGNKFHNDIAVIVLKQAFNMTTAVRPVCVDWDSKYDAQNLRSNKQGYVVGWGYYSHAVKKITFSSETLTVQSVTFVPNPQCQSQLVHAYVQFISNEKFCAGSNVCTGDAGGGLVYKDDNKYYIIGVATVFPRAMHMASGCQIGHEGMYTKVSSHINFIKQMESKNRS